MISLGLLGKSIGHSKSQEVYESILSQKVNYVHFDFSSSQDIPPLAKLFEQVYGLSITAPYKTHFFDQVSTPEQLSDIKAINCIRKTNVGFEGTNTDLSASSEILSEFIKNYGALNIIVLGSGSMAKVIKKASEQLKLKPTFIDRKSYGPLEKFDLRAVYNADARPHLVINACSREFEFKGSLPKNSVFWDLNYNLAHHEYLASYCTYIDGYGLLYLQAKHALKFWGIPYST